MGAAQAAGGPRGRGDHAGSFPPGVVGLRCQPFRSIALDREILTDSGMPGIVGPVEKPQPDEVGRRRARKRREAPDRPRSCAGGADFIDPPEVGGAPRQIAAGEEVGRAEAEVAAGGTGSEKDPTLRGAEARHPAHYEIRRHTGGTVGRKRKPRRRCLRWLEAVHGRGMVVLDIIDARHRGSTHGVRCQDGEDLDDHPLLLGPGAEAAVHRATAGRKTEADDALRFQSGEVIRVRRP